MATVAKGAVTWIDWQPPAVSGFNPVPGRLPDPGRYHPDTARVRGSTPRPLAAATDARRHPPGALPELRWPPPGAPRHPRPTAGTPRGRVPHRGGRRRGLSGNAVQPVAGARLHRLVVTRKHDEFDPRRKSLRMAPARQLRPLVAAHDPEPSQFRPRFTQGLGRLIGIGHLFATNFEILDFRPWQVRCRQPQHGQPVRRGGGRAAGLVRGQPAWHEPHLIEPQRLAGPGGHPQMPCMDRIKGPAEQCDLPGVSHGVSRGPGMRRVACPPSRGTAGSRRFGRRSRRPARFPPPAARRWREAGPHARSGSFG